MTFGDLFWAVPLLYGIVVLLWPSAKNHRIWTVLLVTRIVVWALTGM